MSRLPPFGKTIAARVAHKNPPEFVAVCIGLDSWQRAKARNESPSKIPAVVLPPGDSPHAYTWLVAGSFVIVECDDGPNEDRLDELATALLTAGAVSVCTWWPGGRHEITRYFSEAMRDAG